MRALSYYHLVFSSYPPLPRDVLRFCFLRFLFFFLLWSLLRCSGKTGVRKYLLVFLVAVVAVEVVFVIVRLSKVFCPPASSM